MFVKAIKQGVVESHQNTNEQDSDMPKMYVRDFSIRIDAGEERFCSFIDLEPSHKLSVSYKVLYF